MKSAAGRTGRAGDRGGEYNRPRPGSIEERHRGAGDSDGAEDIDAKDAWPLLIFVVFDRALRADSCVCGDDIDVLGDVVHGFGGCFGIASAFAGHDGEFNLPVGAERSAPNTDSVVRSDERVRLLVEDLEVRRGSDPDSAA